MSKIPTLNSFLSSLRIDIYKGKSRSRPKKFFYSLSLRPRRIKSVKEKKVAFGTGGRREKEKKARTEMKKKVFSFIEIFISGKIAGVGDTPPPLYLTELLRQSVFRGGA